MCFCSVVRNGMAHSDDVKGFKSKVYFEVSEFGLAVRMFMSSITMAAKALVIVDEAEWSRIAQLCTVLLPSFTLPFPLSLSLSLYLSLSLSLYSLFLSLYLLSLVAMFPTPTEPLCSPLLRLLSYC
jgi:hypothetical protein